MISLKNIEENEAKIASNSIETERYAEYSKMAKAKILDVISNEGVEIKPSFQNSIVGRTSYIEVNRLEENKKLILIPQFNDSGEMEQGITFAHILGHYYVQQELKYTKSKFLKLKAGFSSYYKQKLAWNKAEELLKNENIIAAYNRKTGTKGTPEQIRALADFQKQKRQNLADTWNVSLGNVSGYFDFLINAIKIFVYCLLISYVFLGIIVVFERNGVPTMLGSGIDHEAIIDNKEFFSTVTNLGSLFLALYLTVIGYKLLLKNVFKRK